MPPGIFERLPDLSLLTTGRDSAGGQIAVLQGADLAVRAGLLDTALDSLFAPGGALHA